MATAECSIFASILSATLSASSFRILNINQNAVLISEKIEDATPAFYAPYDFQSATLDGYEEYIYTLQRVQVDQNGNKKTLASETRSIFDNFPIVKWEDQGKVVEKEQFISK